MKNLLIVLIGIALFSCKDDDEGNIASGSTTSNCRIVKEEIIYNNDTLYKSTIDYIYSGELLVKKIEGDRFGTNDSIMYVYNSDNRISHTLEFDYFTMVIDTSAIFEYNQSGNLSKATQIRENRITAELLFQYSSNQLNEIVINYPNSGGDRAKIISDASGNILEYELTELDGQLVSNTRGILDYDTHKNPYLGFYSEEVNLFEMFASNNITSLKFYDNGILDFNYNTNYMYNIQGFPLTSTTTDSYGDVTTHTYSYECF